MCSNNADSGRLQTTLCAVNTIHNLTNYIYNNTRTIQNSLDMLNIGLTNSVGLPPSICIPESDNVKNGKIKLASFFNLSGFLNMDSFSLPLHADTPITDPSGTILLSKLETNGDIILEETLIPGVIYRVDVLAMPSLASLSANKTHYSTNLSVCGGNPVSIIKNICIECKETNNSSNCATVTLDLRRYIAGYDSIAGGIEKITLTSPGEALRIITGHNGQFTIHDLKIGVEHDLTAYANTTSGSQYPLFSKLRVSCSGC